MSKKYHVKWKEKEKYRKWSLNLLKLLVRSHCVEQLQKRFLINSISTGNYQKKTINKINFNKKFPQKKKRKKGFLKTLLHICDIFAFDFIFLKPCEDLKHMTRKA